MTSTFGLQCDKIPTLFRQLQMADDIISGSVIERTFVGRDLPVALFASSVPLNEVAAKVLLERDSAGFRDLVAEVIAVPTAGLLDEEQYRRLLFRLMERSWPSTWLSYLPRPFSDEWFPTLSSREQEFFGELESERGRPLRMFAEHSIALMVSNNRAVTPYWFGFPLRGLELETDKTADETALATGVACASARLQRSERTNEFTKAVLQYDVPFGSSPRASSDSLLKLLDTGKKMCLAPIVTGGTLGITQLGQGHYVAALLCAGTGGLMTLILLSSVAVGSLLVARVAQRRGSQE